jgi:hypothetical protein
VALSPQDLARAVDLAASLLGRSVGAIPAPGTGAALVRTVGLAEVEYEAVVTAAGHLRSADLLTSDDVEALGALGANVGRLDATAGALLDDDTPTVRQAAEAVVTFVEASTLRRAFEARIASVQECAHGGGSAEQCAQAALALAATPRTPRLTGGAGLAVFAAASAALLAIGALAVYASRRKHFLAGFYSPVPARITARARRGAPRGDTYDLEVE